MKKRSRLQIVLWLAFALILSCSLATAQPPIHHFYGIVTVGGLSALDGTVVTAKIDGVPVENTETFDGGKYVFNVPGEPGDTIVFFVDGLQAEDHAYQGGASTELNLSVPAPEFEVSDLVIDPNEVGPGEALTITADVTNAGEVRFTYTVTLRIDNVEEATEEVVLAGGATTAVSFAVTRDVPGTYSVDVDGLSGSFRVLEPKPAEFKLSDLSITPSSVETGESVSISVTVTNTGDLGGTHTLTLFINGAVEDTKDVTLAGGGAASVTFGITKSVAGTYGVEVDGLTGSFQVIEPTTPPPTPPPPTPPAEFSEFTVTSLMITPSEVLVGNQAAINVDVKNVGNVEGTYTLTLRINDVLTQTRDVTLAGGASETVTFTVIENEEGTYNVAVDGVTGSFTVVAPPLLPAAFTVSSLTISPSEVAVGEEVTISVTVQNTGDLEGTYTVTLKINGIIENIEDVTLAGGTTESVTFMVDESTGGTYNVEVDGLTGAFVVTESAPPPGPTPPPTGPVIGLWMTGGIIAAAVIISVVVFYVRRRR